MRKRDVSHVIHRLVAPVGFEAAVQWDRLILKLVLAIS
jgi:hypothetical protein